MLGICLRDQVTTQESVLEKARRSERVTVSVLDASPGVPRERVFGDAFCSSASDSRDLTSATSSLSVTLASS